MYLWGKRGGREGGEKVIKWEGRGCGWVLTQWESGSMWQVGAGSSAIGTVITGSTPITSPSECKYTHTPLLPDGV